MRIRLLVSISAFAGLVLLPLFPTGAWGQACFGRPAQGGELALSGTMEPQVEGFGGAADWNPKGAWSLRVEGASVGEFISQADLDAGEAWTIIGTVVEGQGEDQTTYPTATRRTSVDRVGVQAALEFLFSDWSVCAAGGVEGLTGKAEFTQRITYLDAIGARWARGTQDYSGFSAPLSLAAGYDGFVLGEAEVIPFVSVTYWVDRVSFDRADRDFDSDGWFGRVGATLLYGRVGLGLSHRTGDDLRDGSLMMSLAYLLPRWSD